ncbi:MAG: deoxyhypusine synthase family protein [Planctomycetes bacterium]|nr:deoxyhypusine synthase family protein [Planctomycetota bacterium]
MKKNSHPIFHHPVVPLVPGRMTAAEYLDACRELSFQARSLGIAFDIWQKALRDDTTIFLGLSGAMTPAGLRKVVAYLLENRLVDVLVTTGANVFHDIHETVGKKHFQIHPNTDDKLLRKHYLDRIYDVLGEETEYGKHDALIARTAASLPKRPYSTREWFHEFGKVLDSMKEEDGIVTAALKAGVPIYAPALGDSSYGIAMASRKESQEFLLHPVKDVRETALIAAEAPRTGIVFIGGGTPKNFTQQTEVTAEYMGFKMQGHKYCIQITTDSPQWGGLSGCTFEESTSWGKIHFEAEKIAVYSDATIALPLLVCGLAEIQAHRFRPSIPRFTFGEELKITRERTRKPVPAR